METELEWERTRLREHRELLNTMRKNSTLAHDQMRSLLQQLDAKKEDIDQLVVDNVVKFDAMKTFFDSKIKELNDVAANEITRLQAECEKSNNYNKEVRIDEKNVNNNSEISNRKFEFQQLKQQLTDMAEKLNESRSMLLKIEEELDVQGIELAQTQLNCHKFEKLYKESNKKYEDSTAQLMEQQLAIDKVLIIGISLSSNGNIQGDNFCKLNNSRYRRKATWRNGLRNLKNCKKEEITAR